MKTPFFAILIVLVVGCGSLSSNSSQPSGQGSDLKTPEPDSNAPQESVSTSSNDKPELIHVTGLWENSSCGERKYRRTIKFLDDGRFLAVDEVAPCPPGRKCVWSGIINWQGKWIIDAKAITIEAQPDESGKLPENLPSEFVILGEDPISIGERSGEIICPYQKGK